MKKTKGFGLFGVVIIMIITALVSSVATGVIMLNSTETNYNKDYTKLTEDEDLAKFIDVYNTLVNKYYDEIDKKGMIEAAEAGMLNFLGDQYTTFLEDSEYNDILSDLASTYNGIGITIENNKIINIASNSPAEKSGLAINDLIIKVNDHDVTTKTGGDIAELIKEYEGKVLLTVNRNGLELNFEVEKAELLNVATNYYMIENTTIGYLSIAKFSENLDSQVKKALTELENKGMTSLIIDVRNNVGGYLKAAEDTSALFLEEGKVIYSLETSNNTSVYKDSTKEKKEYKIVVLINGASASASEILAAALKESYGATLVGNKSYGKGKVQQIISESAKYTFAKWLTPNGTCIDGIGIKPDYVVDNINGDYTDYQLNKAIELLS